jgi:nucleotidyltransferase/DNA polymerase involved in DNA repair
MSVLYCTIPHFATALARRDDPERLGGPLVLVGPEERVFGLSAEAAACGVVVGMTARMAQVRCPEARLLDADIARCRAELEALFQVLEEVSPEVEPHGWGAAYVDLDDLAQDHADAVAICQQVGRDVRRELGQALQPALGWDSGKFTAQAAARRTQPGHLRAVDGIRERDFLRPLPVSLLPLQEETLQRLCFLGLRTLGQYAVLPRAAVWQQFGRVGMLAHRCARGEDDRPVVARWHAPQLAAEIEFELPLTEHERLLGAARHLVSPLLVELRGNLQACGQVRLAVHFDDGSIQERERAFLFPVAEEERVVRTLGQLLDGMKWQAAATVLAVSLAQIQDAVAEQLALFPLENERGAKLREVERYLAARFGTSPLGGGRLRRPVLAQPGAPLPEWRIGWQSENEL